MIRHLKKITPYIALFSTLFIAISCKQFTDDVELFLNYWSNEATIIKDNAQSVSSGTDESGFICLPSNTDITITLTVRNPQNYQLLMPSAAGAPSDIIIFPNASPQPVHGTDFTLEQTNTYQMELTFKQAFLADLTQTEKGQNDLSCVITLYNSVGRKFPNPYTLKLKSNTAPPAAKDQLFMFDGGTPPEEYILCFNLPTFAALHTDVNRLVIDGTTYKIDPATYAITNEDGSTPPANIQTDISGMTLQPTVPGGASFNGTHPVYFHTGVHNGDSKKNYTVTVKDEKGLASSIMLSTGAGKLEMPKTYDKDGNLLTGLGATTNLSVEHGQKAVITLKAENYVDGTSAGSGVQIAYTITPAPSTGSGSLSNTTASPATIELKDWSGGPLSSTYTITAIAKKTGDTDSAEQRWIITVKSVAVVEIPISGDPRSPWKQLKDEVESGTAEIIKINGEIKASNSGIPDTHITVNRTVRIEAKSGTATINAASHATNTAQQRRIFNVASGGDLTLVNLILQNGKIDIANGGGICLASGTSCTMQGCTIQNCEATYTSYSGSGPIGNGLGGAIFSNGANVTIKNSTIQNCKALRDGALSQKGGQTELDQVRIAGCESTNLDSTSGKIKSCGGCSFGGGSAANAIIRNSTIENCRGMGLYARQLTTVRIENSRITNNGQGMADDAKGKGCYISNPKVHISGNTVFENNDVQIFKPGVNSNETVLVIDKALTATPLAAELNMGTYTENAQVIQLASPPPAGVILADQVAKFKVKDAPDGSKWFIDNAGTLQKKLITTWAELKAAVEDTSGPSVIELSSDITAQSGDTRIDLPAGRTVTIKSDTAGTIRTINANSASAGNRSIFKLDLPSANLTIQDIKLTGGRESTAGAVYISNTSTFKMIDSEISGNQALSGKGGGVYLGSGFFTMEGGSITGNTASDVGGGVYVDNGDTFTMNGGTISGNTSTAGKGSGVYVAGFFKMNGAAKVGGGSQSNTVYLENGKTINITGALTGSSTTNPAATIEPETYTTVAVLTGSSYVGTNYDKFKVKDASNGDKWQINSGGTLQKADSATIDGNDSNAWQNLKDAVEGKNAYAANPPEEITIQNTITAPSTAAAYDAIIVKRKVKIVGSTGNAAESVIDAGQNNFSVLTVTRSGSNAGDLTLENLTLQKGEKSPGAGGGVFAKDCNLTMTNVHIKGCKAQSGGGVNWLETGQDVNLHMSKCVISDNHATSGNAGGLYVQLTSSTDSWLKDCTIKSNYTDSTSANMGGGGLYVYRGSGTNSLKLTNCTITANHAPTTGKGGGIYVNGLGSSETLRLLNDAGTQTTITGNTGALGRGIYIEGAGQVALGKDFGIDGDNGIYLAGTDTNQINLKEMAFNVKDSGGTSIPWKLTPEKYNERKIISGYTDQSDNFQVVPKIESGNKTYYSITHENVASGGKLVEQTEFHVKSDGDDTTGYGTNESPFVTLQHAIDSCRTAGKDYKIRILDDLSGNAACGNVNEARKITIYGSGGIRTLDATGTGKNVLTIGQGGAEVRLKYLTIKGGTKPAGSPGGSGILLSAGTLTLVDASLKVDPANDIYVNNASGSGAVLKALNLKSHDHTIGIITPKEYGAGKQILDSSSTGLENAPITFEITPYNNGAREYFWVLDANGQLQKQSEFYVKSTSTAPFRGTKKAPFKTLLSAYYAITEANSTVYMMADGNAGNVELEGKTLTLKSDNSTYSRKLTGDTSGKPVLIVGGNSSGSQTTFTLENITIAGHSSMDNQEQSGIVVKPSSELILSGDKARVDTKHDIYLDMSVAGRYAKLTVQGTPPSGKAARLTLSHYRDGDQILSGSSGDISSWASHFTLTNNSYSIKSDGTLERLSTVIDGSSGTAWSELQSAITVAADGGTIYIKGEITAPSGASSLKLDSSKSITIMKESGASSATINADKQCGIFEIGNRYASSSCKITIDNVILKKGEGSANIGAGVNLLNYGSFTMKGTSIIQDCINNYAVIVGPLNSTFTMESGTLSNNAAGDVKVGVDTTIGGSGLGTFTMNGGTITGSAEKSVYIDKYRSTFSMKGAAKIDGKYVYLKNGKKINIAGALTADPAATIWPEIYPTGGGTAVTVLGGSTTLVQGNHSKFKVKEYDSKEWTIKSDGTLEQLGTSKTISAGSEAWKALKEEVEKTSGGADIIIIDGSITATNSSSNFGEIRVPNGRTVTIKGKTGKDDDCLNADCDNTGKKHRIFNVEAGGNLILEDLTLENAQYVGAFGGNKLGGCIFVKKGQLTMTDCTIFNCTAKDQGGGIYVEGTTTGSSLTTVQYNVNLTRVLIDHNTSQKDSGGGLFIKGVDVKVTLTNSIISNNTVPPPATALSTANKGSAIYLSMGRLLLDGGTISNNSTDTSSSKKMWGVYIWPTQTEFTIGGNLTIESSNGITLDSDPSDVLGKININTDLSITSSINLTLGRTPSTSDKVLDGAIGTNNTKFIIDNSGGWSIKPDGYLKQ